MKALRLPTATGTNSLSDKFTTEFQSLVPLHDGKFLVRTYGMLRLYSADFHVLSAMNLPSTKGTSSEDWKFSVSPSGTRIYAVHGEDFLQLQRYVQTRYLIDADTLRIIRVIPTDERPFGAPWGRRIDMGNSSASWGPIYHVAGVKRRTIFVAGRPLLTLPDSRRKAYGTSRLTGSLFAAKVFRRLSNFFDRTCPYTLLRLDIFDLASKSLKCSIPATKDAGFCGDGFLFDISPSGDVAVIQGTTLSLYCLGAGGN